MRQMRQNKRLLLDIMMKYWQRWESLDNELEKSKSKAKDTILIAEIERIQKIYNRALHLRVKVCNQLEQTTNVW